MLSNGDALFSENGDLFARFGSAAVLNSKSLSSAAGPVVCSWLMCSSIRCLVLDCFSLFLADIFARLDISKPPSTSNAPRTYSQENALGKSRNDNISVIPFRPVASKTAATPPKRFTTVMWIEIAMYAMNV